MEADMRFVVTRLRPYLVGLLEAEQAAWKERGAPWQDPPLALVDYLDGGKALRPRFCHWGHAAAGGTDTGEELARTAAALELLHAFALVHDDLMDGSAERRGRPALHRQLAGQHREHRWLGDPEAYGTAAALLVGDIAFALANRLARTLPEPAQLVWTTVVDDLTVGQFLDLAGTARRDRALATARTMTRLKSGQYTVTGPLRLGAAVAGRELPPTLARYGDLVGEAFQLRDDVLGVFGDTADTGKPVGDDLRAGKPTQLLAELASALPDADRALLDRAGATDIDDADVEALRAAIVACGALDRVERRIRRNLHAAHRLLDLTPDLPAEARDGLRRLAEAAVMRRR